MIRAIIKIGLPTAIGGSTMQLGTLIMTRNVNVYGYIATSAYGIGNQNQQSYHNASQWCRFRRFYYSWTKIWEPETQSGRRKPSIIH